MKINQQNQTAQKKEPSFASASSSVKTMANKAEKSEEKLKELYQKKQEEEVSQRANQIGLAYADLSIIPVSPEALEMIKRDDAKSAEMAIISKKGSKLHVAIADPDSQTALSILNKLKEKGFSIATLLVSKKSLKKAWRSYDDISEKQEANDKISLESKDLSDFDQAIKSISELKDKASKIPITEVIETIFAGALKTGASDIHLEPGKNNVRLRYRLDGVLNDIAQLPLSFYPYAVSRFKMLAGLKLNVSNIPQDGRIGITLDGEEVDLRVSSMPGNYGENFVMRVLKQQSIKFQFEDLGIRGRALELLESALKKPNGMILTTGPTGSGKTTTLYAFLNKINTPDKKIITLEDPIEYRMEGIEQTQIDSEAGYTFASGLRAILRQDPDTILVGEIRDEETAKTAIQAALTGHVVFSTIHTNDAPGAIPRLINLQISPTMLEPAINAFIAQRLVRRLCPHCKEQYEPAQEIIEKIKTTLSSISDNAGVAAPKTIKFLYRSKGCDKCGNIGYKGRLGLFEIFKLNPEIEKFALEENISITKIRESAVKDGMVTLSQDGILKAVNGITTLEEVYRVTGEKQ